jgi:hypothetical protein
VEPIDTWGCLKVPVRYNKEAESFGYECGWGCAEWFYDTAEDAEWGLSDHICFGRLEP